MKTIIVPLDFSNESITGLNLSLMMANKTGANIQMVHVIRKNENTDKEFLEKEHVSAEKKFEDMLRKNKKNGEFKGVLGYSIKAGKIFDEVTNLANTYDDPLVILSTHGESGFEELFIGGNAYKITSHSRNPVITIRRSPIPANIDKIVLPLDITFQTREKVPYTANLAKLFHSEIHILTVSVSNINSIEKKLQQYAEQVASYLNLHKIPYTVEHKQGLNLTDIILDYAKTVDADLISIMTEQEKSISNLLLGSFAHQMINKAFIPVLSFPTHQLTMVSEDFRTEGPYYG